MTIIVDINTVGFTTANKTGGVHKFKLKNGQNHLRDIRIY